MLGPIEMLRSVTTDRSSLTESRVYPISNLELKRSHVEPQVLSLWTPHPSIASASRFRGARVGPHGVNGRLDFFCIRNSGQIR